MRPSTRYLSGFGSEVGKVVVAGLVAGTLATVTQMLLWVATGEDASGLFLRDTRLTAALLLGRPVLLPTAGVDIRVLLAATGVHYSLSVVYAALLLPLAKRLTSTASMLAGAFFGALLYFFNLYALTSIFTWFAEARGSITLAVHVVFGLSVMIILWLNRGAFIPWSKRTSCEEMMDAQVQPGVFGPQASVAQEKSS